jgi:hypothetical protein
MKRKMVRQALSALPWLGCVRLGFGGGWVYPLPAPAAFMTLTMPHTKRELERGGRE